MKWRKFYLGALFIVVIGWSYVAYSLYGSVGTIHTVCIFKNVTGVPCPSCGSTRSVMNLLHGNFNQAFLTNPLGYIIAIVLLVLPVLLLIDGIKKTTITAQVYTKIIHVINQPKWAITGILLIVSNWIWGIYKGL